MTNNEFQIGRRQFLAVAGGAISTAGLARAEAAAWRVRRVPLDMPEPGALAVDAGGAVYVGGDRVVAVLASDGKESRRFPVDGQVGCMTISPDRRLLLGFRRRIEMFEPTGARVARWDELDERAWLTSLAADADNVYAADAGNRVVMRFDNTGKVVARIGAKDAARGVPGFNVPSPYFDVAINPLGELWATNPGMHGLENYRANGDLVSSWYRPGIAPEAFCGCCNPSHIAFRGDSSMVTAEKGLERIKIYAPDTTLMEVVEPGCGDGDAAIKRGVQSRIADLAVDGLKRILALNRQEKAILFYEA